jgi:hypothetical protein
MNRRYFIGISKDRNTAVIEARRDKDNLSCELYDYFGERMTTKRQLKQNAAEFLAYLKTYRPNVYGSCTKLIVN